MNDRAQLRIDPSDRCEPIGRDANNIKPKSRSRSMIDFVVGNDGFGSSLAASLGCGFVQFREEHYPDEEPCPQIVADYGDIEGKEVVLALRTAQKPTKEKIALYLHSYQRALGSLTDEELYNAKAVDVLLPYFLLGRQDHNPKTDRDEDVRTRDRGKDVGYRNIVRTFKGLGARKIITFNPHFFRQEGLTRVCGMEIVSLSGAHALGRYFKGRVDADTIVLSPDVRGNVLSEQLAKVLGLKPGSLKKKRIDGIRVETKDVYDASGLNVIFVDDIISTAGTLKKAIDSLYNADEVVVSCVHPVLPQTGYDRLVELKNSGAVKNIVATDTLDSDFSKTSVIPEVVKYYVNH